MRVEVGGKHLKVRVVNGSSRGSVYAKFLSEQEVELRIPRWMGKGELDTFLQTHRGWLEGAYKRSLKRKPVFKNGCVLFNGQYLKVKQLPTPVDGIEVAGNLLFVHTQDILRVKELIEGWLEERTREYLESKEPIFKRFSVKSVRVKHSKTRWGYCSRKREITFHPFLISLPERLQEYLVYHEIAHLYELNHSWRYKARLEKLVPDYRDREKELRMYLFH